MLTQSCFFFPIISSVIDLYCKLYSTDYIKWAFKIWKYRFIVKCFKKFEKHTPRRSYFRVCPPPYLERIVALGLALTHCTNVIGLKIVLQMLQVNTYASIKGLYDG